MPHSGVTSNLTSPLVWACLSISIASVYVNRYGVDRRKRKVRILVGVNKLETTQRGQQSIFQIESIRVGLYNFSFTECIFTLFREIPK
jgi:hypothetical protein